MSNTSSLPVARIQDILEMDIKAVEEENIKVEEEIEAAVGKVEKAAALHRAIDAYQHWWKKEEPWPQTEVHLLETKYDLRKKEHLLRTKVYLLRKKQHLLRKKQEKLHLLRKKQKKQHLLRKEKADQTEVSTRSPERPIYSWTKLGDVQSVDYNAESVIRGERETITRPGCFIDYSGLNPRTTDEQVVLYCRENFRKQFEFLHTVVVRDSKIGWIMGHPGGGKSITTLAFAATLLPSDWLITWVHLRLDYHPICVRFDDVAKSAVDVSLNTFYSVGNSLFEPTSSKRKHIVFVDGVVPGDPKMYEHQFWFNTWVLGDREQRRLVYVSSVSSRGKTRPQADNYYGVHEFFVYSWTLEEYLSGAAQPSFFNNVTAFLDADLPAASSSGELISNAADLVEAKFHFAGGSCRFMFDMTTEAVIKSIDDSLKVVPDVMPYIRGFTGGMTSSINRLFNAYPKSSSYWDRHVSVVSSYAVSELGILIGPDLIKELAFYRIAQEGRLLEGRLLESYFFARLRHNGVDLVANDAPIKWLPSTVQSLDPGNVSAWSVLSADTAFWMKPRRCSNGGYDACYIVPKDGLVRFVQVTRAKDHSFKLGFFSSLLKQLNAHFPVKTVEVFFVVPKLRLRLVDIPHSKISGRGLLEEFDKSWVKGEEMKRVQIVGILFEKL